MNRAPDSFDPQALPGAATSLSAKRTLRLVGLTLFAGYLIVLSGTFLNGDFFIDRQGRPIANDFVNVAAAGRLALDGKPAAAYDWPAHKQAEVRVIGHDFSDYYGWHYPPTFLFVAAALATLPFLAAAAVSLIASFALYVAALWNILGRTGIFVALGFPAALWNVTAGQNGFLTAALIGGTLGLLERRPALAGICLGLLTYKPQFGLLFPLVLIADRRWATITVAAATAVGLALVSLAVFGSASWEAFIHWLPITSQAVLGEGRADFGRLQSVYGLVRDYGGSGTLAWMLQGPVSLALAVMLVWLWRSAAPYDLKAAALAAATLAVTPYVYMYDLVVLAVAAAFLIRFALDRGFATREVYGLAAAGALIFSFPYVKTQVGLAAVLIVLTLVTQRALAPPPARP
ncbi:MAG TPA: glycosyltransferase family 87 protein [Xanthobacteraceae bacterium]|nr:glycosyltransferase family 87 protein [Xanthobacteraceae bacterium]